MRDARGTQRARVELREEAAAVEVGDLLQVAEDEVTATTKSRRDVIARHLRDVVRRDKLEGADVGALRVDHLGEDQGQRPAMRGREREVEGADVGPLRVHTISERIRDSALR